MSLTIQRVKVADILPLVDEYGNEFVSRDYDLEANKAYVSELAASFGESGEPDEPVKLVRDGDAYRIKAGNTRVRAMRELGTDECWAVIDDEDTVQSVLETVVRTNTKKKYEPVEESRFVQQLAMFGDDEYVGRVSMVGAENAGKLRRAREMAGDRAGQMSLDRMYALVEFEGYPELANRVMDADEDGWRADLDDARREKRMAEQETAFRAEAARLRIALVDERPEELRYIKAIREPDQISGAYMEAAVNNKGIIGRLVRTWGGCSIDLYGAPLDEDAEKAEEAERRRRVERLDGILDDIDESMLEWVRRTLDSKAAKPETVLKKMPALVATAERGFYNQWYVKEALNLFPECKGRGIGIADFAVGYESCRVENGRFSYQVLSGRPLMDHVRGRLRKYVDWVGLHVSDGWEPDEDQAGAMAALQAKLEDKAEEGAENGDE